MAEHNTLVGTQLHEPKGIAGSVVADAGKVITPSSSGASELRYLTPEEVGITPIYGEMALNQSTQVLAVTASSDSTLYSTTGSNYVSLDATAVPGVFLDQSLGITFNGTTNSLIIPADGVYETAYWMNLGTEANNTKVAVKKKINATFSSETSKIDIKDAGRVQHISGGGLVALSAGDTMSLAFSTDKTTNITVQDLRLKIFLIKAL